MIEAFKKALDNPKSVKKVTETEDGLVVEFDYDFIENFIRSQMELSSH